jgi:hypothetical protein
MSFFGTEGYRALTATQDSVDNFITAGCKRRLRTICDVLVFKLLVIHHD